VHCSAVREQALIVEAISGVRPKLPFPILGLDTDNDSVLDNKKPPPEETAESAWRLFLTTEEENTLPGLHTNMLVLSSTTN
jgi:hypothetical protein